MARGQTAYNRHVSATMQRLKPHSQTEARSAMKQAAASWKGRATVSNPAGGTSIVRLGLLAAGAYLVYKMVVDKTGGTQASARR